MEKNQHLYDCHELFNNHFFDGQLNTIKISVTDFIDLYGFPIWGYYDADNNEIALTNNGHIYLTLLHEMIHQYQKEFDTTEQNHGKIFKQYASYIARVLNINKHTI